MNNYDNIIAIYDDSSLRVTMERYGYNLWALAAIIGVIAILRVIDKSYLYNAIVIFILVAFFSIYLSYVRKVS